MYGIGTEVSPSSGRLQTVIRSRNAIVAVFPHPNDGPVELAGGTERTGVNFHVKTDGNDDLDGLSWDTAKVTIGYGSGNKGAMNSVTAGRGDQIHVRPGDYTEAEINADKADVQIVGHGANGAVGITPAAGISAMKITANDVVLRNLRIEGNITADYGLSVGDFDNTVLGARVYGCLLRNGSSTTKPAVLIHGAGDLYLIGNDIAWAGIGIEYKSNTDSFCTQIFQLGNLFHNLLVQHLAQHVTGSTDAGKVLNLNHIGNKHDNLEDGTEPSGVFIELDHTGTSGLIEDNSFAVASNAIAKFVIATNVHWVANKTEAGVSSARPA
ncbi:MAG TPA: hypothetical protein ENH62_06345 [Marinobacter sp.]|nr:hypothetical protein [Marinobacter sp.]